MATFKVPGFRRSGLGVYGLGLVLLAVSACSSDHVESVPTKLSGVTAVATAFGLSCAALRDGKVLCWGLSANSERGAAVEGVTAATAVSVGNGFACALPARLVRNRRGRSQRGLFA
ncbi:MAG: hypothetical protein ABI548_22420 [Polyangiaceae bacterium]